MMPWNFTRIPGLEEEKEALRRLAQGERIPHAQLFLGEYGSAALGLALAFARLVLCEHSGDEPCESCHACQKSGKWVHPDLHFSYPVIGTDKTSQDFLPQWRTFIQDQTYGEPVDWFMALEKENKSGNINVAECQQIARRLSYTTVEGRYKILLLWGAEYLGKEGNRLLKLIEEPPERTLFLFVGADTERILPTVMSRCQLTKVRRFRDEEVAESLLARGLAGRQEAEAWSYLADGNLGQALRMARQSERPVADLVLTWFRQCWSPKGTEMITISDQLARLGKEDQRSVLNFGLHLCRQILFALNGQPELIRLPEEEQAAAIKMASVLDLERLGELASLFDDALMGIDRNANTKILFLNASIQIHAILKDQMRYSPNPN